MSEPKHATDTYGDIVIYDVPSPSEVFASDTGTVPDSWREVARAGSEIGGKRSATLLQLLAPKCCFLYGSRTWNRINLKVRSAQPRPGEGNERFVRFLEADVVRILELTDGQLLSVSMHEWWRTPSDYAEHFPDAAYPEPTREHTEFGHALRAGGSE